MNFLAIVLALLLEQIRPPGAHNPVVRGLRAGARRIVALSDAGATLHGWLAWLLAALLPALLAALVHLLALEAGGWLLALIWSVAVLYFTLGFRQFSQHFTLIREALEAGEDEQARQLLAQWPEPEGSRPGQGDLPRQAIEACVLAAHRQVFGVLACASVLAVLGLGPAGAVLYRAALFARRDWPSQRGPQDAPVSQALADAARAAWHAIDWLPVRMTALVFAVVGSFEDAIDCWKNCATRFADPNEGVLLAATAGALDVRLGPGAPSPSLPGSEPQPAHLPRVAALLWRAVALWLFLLALLTLARVLG